MNRNGGLWTGLIALIAVAVHLSVPSTRETRQTPASTNPGATDKSSTAAEASSASDFVPEGPWIATRYFFADPRPVVELPPASQVTRDWFGIPPNRPVKFLLATVPDPLHTRLSLLTDSAISAIQDAAAKAGWEIATQWLPWTNVAEADPKDIEKRTHARAIAREQEKEPGVLAFRHKVTCGEKKSLTCAFDPRVLLIFLIGETPTAGVNPFQFQLARKYVRAIQSSNESVRILGPTFSGSFQSLADRISEDIAISTAAKQTETDYFVKSGTTSDQNAIDAFSRSPQVHFESLNSNLNFTEVLTSLRIPPTRAALLVEDESGYGESEVNLYFSKNDIRIFRFPRDISHLRNASPETPASPKPNQPPSTDVDFSLKDTDLGEDGIPEFSKNQTPLSQNSVLGEIANFVRREEIRVVQINATNVLDLLFLSHVLKLQCPDTRIVVPYADLLFVEAAQSQALAGVLVESTYPMFAAANDWMGNKRLPATFPDANAQAFYNAAALLLQIGEPVYTAPPLANYYWKGLPHPKWLLLVDREGLLPVRILPSPGPPENSPPLPGPSPVWIALSGASTVLSLALVGWIWFMCSNLEPRILAQFALDPQEGSSPDRWRLLYLFSFALSLMALQLVLAVPFAHSKMTWDMALTKVLPDIGFCAALVVAVWSLLVALDVKSNSPDPKLLRLAAAAIQFLFFLAFAGLWAICCFYGDDHAFFFSFRALELRIGSSPLWPILSGLAILLIFSATNISRLYLAVSEFPDVIVQAGQLETIFQWRIKKSYDHLKKSFEAPLGIARRDWYALLTIAVPLVLLFWLGRPDVLLRSIDGRCYDVLAIGLGTAALLCIGLTCVQVTLMWESLRSLLSCLDTLPFACRFMKTDSSSGARPIWVKQLNLQSIDVHSRALCVLHDIALVKSKHRRGPNRWTDWLIQYGDGAKLFIASATRTEARQRRHDLREISKTIAIEAFAEARRSWLSESLVGSLEAPKEVSSEGASPRPHPLVEISGNTNKMGTLAEAFIALHYSPFLMYCVKQIQRLMLFLSVGLLLLVLSLNSYSVQSPQAIARFSLMLFVVVGTVALRCLLGIEKDPILSRIAGTTPGRLTSESYLKLIGYFALPTLGLLASQFPSISNFIYSWVAPTLQSAQ